MRFAKYASVNLSERTIIIASAALVFSGFLQLITAWLQWQTRVNEGANGLQCAPEGVDATSKLKRISDLRRREYTWSEDDYPPSLDFISHTDLNINEPYPSDQTNLFDIDEPVTLTIEDSRHYALSSPDASDDSILELDAEWESVYPGDSAGFVRLGPERRFFGLSMYHQLHCLDALRFSIGGREHAARSLFPNSTYSDAGMNWEERRAGQVVSHTAHCLNYLRQTILCAADTTLEPELVRGLQDVGSGLGVTHVCRDWSKVHSLVQDNYDAYIAWSDKEKLGNGK